MALEELQLTIAILRMTIILFLLLMLFVVHQLQKLGNACNPVVLDNTHHNVSDTYRGLPFPKEESQNPGIHPSMAFRGQIEELRNRFPAMHRYDWEAFRGIQDQLGERRFEREAKESDEVSDVKQEQGAHQELVLADSSHAVGTNPELSEGEEKKQPEKREPPSSVPEESARSAELSPVPRDLDRSDPDTTLATDEQTASDEQPWTSGINATASVASANPKKKRRNKKKKKKKGKKSFEERASADEEKDATASDPETSTDESHHSSIEAFSSNFEEEMKNEGIMHCEPSKGAACPKEKRLDK